MPFHSGQIKKESVSGYASIPLSPNALLAGVIGLTALVYLPVLRYGFVFDDQGIIVENPTIRAWRYLPQYFNEQLWQYLFPNTLSNYYRPLNVVFFRLNHALFRLQPMGWHAYALLLHLLATALVFCIIRRITDHPWAAAAGALLFGIHPSHHEVVAWISSTTESLCAVLFLAAFLAYLKSRESNAARWMTISCLCYAGSILSKETGLVAPALVFAHACLYGVRSGDPPPAVWPRIVRAAIRAFTYAPVCLAYILLRIHVLHGFSHTQHSLTSSAMLLTLPSVLFFYLQQWLIPIRFSEFYDLPVRTHWDFVHVGLPIVAVVTVAAALWFFRQQLGLREVAFGLGAVAIPLVPALNISAFSSGELVHDRYSYLPSVGVALIAGLAFQHLAKGRLVFRMPQRLVLAMLAILLPLTYSSANASSYWKDNLMLFEHANQVAPQNLTARVNYAVELQMAGDKGKAMTMLGDMVKEHPDSYLANLDLGRCLYEANLLPAAEHYLRIAQKLDPSQPDPYLQLGMIGIRVGRTSDSVELFQHASLLRPEDPKYHFALAVAVAQGGDCVRARAEFSQALFLDPALKRAQEQKDKCKVDTAPSGQAGTSALPALAPLTQVNSH